MKRAILAALGASFLLCPITGLAQSGPARPLRHLVYTFTWGTSTDLEEHNSGFGAGGTGSASSGISDYNSGSQDKGTIQVDVLREQPDHGLVVSVSEQAQTLRSAPAATCVVFGNTTVICDPSGKVNVEELTLLRFLGVNFVDADQLDAKGHWQVTRTRGAGYTTTADYTIGKTDGSVLAIDETRVVTEGGSRPATQDVSSKIGYDVGRTLPTSIDEVTTEREPHGTEFQTVKSQTVLELQTDSNQGTK